ncbi:MAG TPA: agmatine deiminase family protein [Planctomycetota bacterium]|nr:agmatine deiminase family protein [Planctomycetota bacterium]
MPDSPKSFGYRMPAEWDPHEGTWLSWPHNPRTWVGNFGPIPSVFAEIVRGLCDHETVHICVRDSLSEASVRKLLTDTGVSCTNVRFYYIPTNDAWARDHGPIFVTREVEPDASAPAGDPRSSNIAIIDWKFNSWGEKYYPWDDDDAVPEKVSAALKLPCFHPRMVLEGGSIDVNGKGSLLTTECVLLNPNRNPSLSRKQIEARLDEYLGASHVIWLGDGIAGDDTDGHIDDITRFVNANTIITVVEDDPADVNYRPLQENFERLKGVRHPNGTSFDIVKFPSPGKVFRGAVHADRPAEERLPASYANFYIGNGSVLVPVFGCENDSKALGLLGEFFPGRKIIGINCKDLVGGYGAIHCVTQQQPRPPELKLLYT